MGTKQIKSVKDLRVYKKAYVLVWVLVNFDGLPGLFLEIMLSGPYKSKSLTQRRMDSKDTFNTSLIV